MTAWARTQLLIAFANNPFDSVMTWTDSTPDLRADSPVKITQGRNNELSKFDTGSLSFVLNNRKRRYDPSNTANVAPWAGNIKTQKPCQLQCEYPWFPGLLPDESLKNTGWINQFNSGSVGPVNTDGYLDPYLQPPAALNWTCTAAGNATINGPQIAWAANDIITFHCRVKCYTNARSMQVGFNCFNSIGTFLGTVSGTALAAGSTGVWYGPAICSGTTLAGTTSVIPWIQALSAAINDVFGADALILDRASAWKQKTMSYVYVDDWKMKYHAMDQTVEVKGSDALKIFSTKDINSIGYQNAVVALAPTTYYRLYEPVNYNGQVVPDLGSANASAVIRQTPTWGLPGPLLADLGTAVGMTSDPTLGGWIDLGTTSCLTGTGQWAMMGWVQTPSVNAGGSNRWFQQSPSGDSRGNAGFINIYYTDTASPPHTHSFSTLYYPNWPSTTGAITLGFNFQPPTLPGKPAGSGTFYDGAWHFVVIKRATDGITYSVYVDGVQVKATVTSGIQSGLNAQSSGIMNLPVARSLIGGGNDSPMFDGQLAEVAFFTGANAANVTPAAITNLYNIAQKAWSSQSPGQRIGVVADTLGFPAGLRNIDAGTAQLMPQTTSLALTNALDYSHYVEDSENGWLLIDSGTLRFIGRQTFLLPPYNTAQYLFGDGGGAELPFENWEPDFNDTLLYTEAEGSRQGYNTLIVYADPTNTSASGKRTISRTNLLNASDPEVLNILQYLLQQYKTVKLRATKMIINPMQNDGLWQAIFGMKIGTMVQVNIRPEPAASPMMTFFGRIQKFDHTIGKKSWKTEVTLGAADIQPYVILDDATYGKLDQGNMYAY